MSNPLFELLNDTRYWSEAKKLTIYEKIQLLTQNLKFFHGCWAKSPSPSFSAISKDFLGLYPSFFFTINSDRVYAQSSCPITIIFDILNCHIYFDPISAKFSLIYGLSIIINSYLKCLGLKLQTEISRGDQ